jgi:hypothetical protein
MDMSRKCKLVDETGKFCDRTSFGEGVENFQDVKYRSNGTYNVITGVNGNSLKSYFISPNEVPLFKPTRKDINGVPITYPGDK